MFHLCGNQNIVIYPVLAIFVNHYESMNVVLLNTTNILGSPYNAKQIRNVNRGTH